MGFFKKKAESRFFYDPSAGTGLPVLQAVQVGSGHPLLTNVGPEGRLVLRPGEVALSSWTGSVLGLSRATLDSPLEIAAKAPSPATVVITDDRMLVLSVIDANTLMLAEVPLVSIWEVEYSWVNPTNCVIGVACFNAQGQDSLKIRLEGQDCNAHFAAAQSIARDVARRRLEASIFSLKWDDRAALTHIVETGAPTQEDPDGPTRWWDIKCSVGLQDYPRFKDDQTQAAHRPPPPGASDAKPNPDAAFLPAMARPLQKESSFSWVERIEFWPELDAPDASRMRDSYPGPEYGLVRGEHGEALPVQPAVKHFQFDRTLNMVAFDCRERWAGQEVYDIHWQTRERTMQATLQGSSVGLDLSLDGRVIAALAWTDGPSLHRIDTTTGGVSPVTTFDRSEMTGGEPVRWSPDGRSVLIGRSSRDKHSLLVDMSSGECTPLPWPGDATWWTAHSPESVLVTRWNEGLTELSRGNVATGELVPLGVLSWPAALSPHRGNKHVYTLDVSPDGRRFVGEVPLGAETLTEAGRAGQLTEVASRSKWATGTLPLVEDDPPPTITNWASEWCWQNTPSLELAQAGPRWCDRARGTAF